MVSYQFDNQLFNCQEIYPTTYIMYNNEPVTGRLTSSKFILNSNIKTLMVEH